MTDQERHQLAKAIFLRVCAAAPDERDDEIRRACAHDPDLRATVEAMLAADGESSGVLEGNTAHRRLAEVMQDRLESDPRMATPRRIGACRVIGVLGSGGMGVVYEGEQDQPRRRVAIKVVRPEFATPDAMRRFQLEAQALARLQHPGIAQIYEAGATTIEEACGSAPTPYFVMERIEGRSLIEFARSNRLTVSERLRLMVAVCDAVHHAHLKGVVHRDLKPANILVVSTPGRDTDDPPGQPKIVDFGVARLAHDAAADSESAPPHATRAQAIGTLPYMSPEQVDGAPEEIDARTDIYALGVILYELIGGRLPLELDATRLADAARRIAEIEPPLLGTIHPSCRGDIEAIAAKAMAKSPHERYASAAALADDIRRHLRDEPIAAHPPSTLYQIRKFASRNRPLVAGASIAAIAVSAALVISVVFSLRLTGARNAERLAKEDALRQAAISEDAQSMLRQALGAANPWVHTSLDDVAQDRRVVDLLDEVAASLQNQSREPAVRAAAHELLANSYLGLGETGEARRHAEEAYTIRRNALGPGSFGALESQYTYAAALYWGGAIDEAERHLRDGLERCSPAIGADHWLTRRYRAAMARVDLTNGKLRESAATLERIIADTPDNADRRSELAGVHTSLGQARYELGEYDAANGALQRALALARSEYGPDHPFTVGVSSLLASLYDRQGRFDEAQEMKRSVYEHRLRVFGADHPRTDQTRNNLAVGYFRLGQYSDAEPLFRQLLDSRRAKLGEDHPQVMIVRNNLAAMCLETGRAAEAEAFARAAADGARRVLPENHWQRGVFIKRHGECLTALHRYDEAEAALLEAYDLLHDALGPDHDATRLTVNALIQLYDQANRAEDRARWAARSRPS